MYCKHCGANMQGEKICPACGMENKENNIWKLLVVILCGLLLVAVITGVVLMAMGIIGGKDAEKAKDDTKGDEGETTTQTDPSGESEPSQPATQDPTGEQTEPEETEEPLLPLGKSYTATDDQVRAAANEVVATLGEQTLTNGELQIFYWYQVYEFLSQYGTYYFDISKGLDTQECIVDDTMTWQEFFLTQALKAWQSYAVLQEQAKADGYTPDAKVQEYIEKLPQMANEDAVSFGYSSLEEMVQKETGAGTSVDAYLAYRTMTYRSVEYFNHVFTGMTPTADEVTQRYEENLEFYQKNNVTKDAGKYVDVRHILICYEEVEGEETPSDATKQKAKAKAEQIYAKWQEGDATEESFAALATEYTEDPGSKQEGGLYTQVAKGQMVTNFDAWIMDESRVKGDNGIVETEFGYHIMYYVGDQVIWYAVVEQDILSERFEAFYTAAEKAYPMEVFADKMALGAVDLAQE